MFFPLVFHVCSSKILAKDSIYLQQLPNIPEFQSNIVVGEDNISTEFPYFNNDIKLEGKYSQSYRLSEILQCTVTIKNATFSSNYAFGSGTSSASGGALYAANSLISTITDQGEANFENNEASIGGGVCLLCCKAFFSKTLFQSNRALKFGGAFYFQGIPDESDTVTDQYLKLSECNFTNNKAHDVGGALCFSNAAHSEIDQSTFTSNVALIGGGAIYSTKTELLISGGSFKNNEVDVKQREIFEITYNIAQFDNTNHSSERLAQRKSGLPRFSARGGGAILFTTLETDHTYRLETKSVCFRGNAVRNGDTFNSEQANSGDNVLLDGNVTYYSNGDDMEPDKIARNSEMLFIYFYYQNATLAGCTGTEVNYSQTIYSYPTESNTGDAFVTSNIATPSPYQYRATPISKLPYPTTQLISYFATYNIKFSVLPSGVNPPENPEAPPSIATPETNSPTRSLVAPIYVTAKSGISTVTFIETIFNTITTKTSTTIVTYGTDNKPTYSSTEILGNFTTSTISLVQTSIILQNSNEATAKKSNMTYIIIGIAAGVALIIVAGTIIWFAMRKRDSDSNSLVDMVEETGEFADSAATTVTNDNPLWTTSVIGKDDDPFKEDFDEEGGVEGYFDANTNELE